MLAMILITTLLDINLRDESGSPVFSTVPPDHPNAC